MNSVTRLSVGFLVDLDELTALLTYISHGMHCWEALNDDAEELEDDMQSVVIRYSNPGGTDLPNQIGFRFPRLCDDNPFFPVEFVCLHPSLAEPVCCGLYFEGADVKYDCLEDWNSFWPSY